MIRTGRPGDPWRGLPAVLSSGPFWRTAALGLLFLTGCDATVDMSPRPVEPDQAVVLLNGEPISLEEFDTEFRLMEIHYSAVTETQMRVIKRRLFDQVVDRRLLVQRARQEGLKITRAELEKALTEGLRDAPPGYLNTLKDQGVDEEAWKRKVAQEFLVRKLVEKDVYPKVEIASDEVEAYYWSHLGDYWEAAALRARHLVVQGPRELNEALKSLKAGVPFEKVAAQMSLAPERFEGGDWGWIPIGDVRPKYRKVLESLKPGEVSGPLRDVYGYHLFQLIENRPTRMQPFVEVRDRIQKQLQKQERDHRFIEWMTDLKKTAVVEVNPELGSTVGIQWEDSRDTQPHKPRFKKKRKVPVGR